MEAALAASQSYFDLNGLEQLRQLGRERAVDRVAAQFESLFLAQMLKSMRSANEVFGGDSPFSSWELRFRQQMFDNQLSLSLAQGRGMGLAPFLARNLKRQLSELGHAQQPPEVSPSRSLRRHYGPVEAPPPRPLPAVAQPRVAAAAGSHAFDDPVEFLRTIAPLARRAAERIGIDAKVLLAQSALETGWGQGIVGNGLSNNLFNIKAGGEWRGPSLAVPTVEYRDGLAIRERHRFRVYSSLAASFDDYVGLVSGSPRYAEAMQAAARPEDYLRRLQQAGYATDPAYADKVLRLLASPEIAGLEL